MAWKYFGPGSPLNTRPDRQTGSMADWKQWIDGLSRYERDQLYPGMHIDLIPAFEKIEGMEEAKKGSQSTVTPLLSEAYSSAAIGQVIMQPPAFTVGNQVGIEKFGSTNQSTLFAENLAFPGASGNPYSSEAPPEIIENEQDDPYSPDSPGWHEYETTNMVCPPELNCSSEKMADFMKRFAVPGQDPGQPIMDGQVSWVIDPRNGIPAGRVRTWVKRLGLEIQNVTLIPHILHDGEITRTASGSPGMGWQVRTYGHGNNVIPFIDDVNEWEGPLIFDYVDNLMAAYIRSNIGN